MSQLRKQLLEFLPEFTRQAKSLNDEDARQRWRKIRYVLLSAKRVRSACTEIGCSYDFFWKWGSQLLSAKEVEALRSKSRAPKKRPSQTKPLWEKRICEAREAQPFMGCERLAQRLLEVHGKKLAPSTVNRILRRKKLISEDQSKRMTKKHQKRYRRPLPGFLQMDFKYVPYKVDGRQLYQLSCIDHHSSWRLIRIYDNKGFEAVESFLSDLKHHVPFPVMQIQTDNDIAFTYKFLQLRHGFEMTDTHPMAEWCDENQVQHKLIPVGEKELNGKVENSHKQDDREFFSQINPQNLTHLQALSAVYEERWNERRKTKALSWKTPDKVVEDAYALVTALFTMVGKKPLGNVINLPKTPTLNPKKLQVSRKKKRKSKLDRYLHWMEEDAKKYGS